GRGRAARRKKSPRVLAVLNELLRDTVAGDPVSGLRWTHRSLRKLRQALRRRGLRVALSTIARLLRDQGFSLRTCRKQQAGIQDPQRDRQFRYLVRMRKLIFDSTNPYLLLLQCVKILSTARGTMPSLRGRQ